MVRQHDRLRSVIVLGALIFSACLTAANRSLFAQGFKNYTLPAQTAAPQQSYAAPAATASGASVQPTAQVPLQSAYTSASSSVENSASAGNFASVPSGSLFPARAQTSYPSTESVAPTTASTVAQPSAAAAPAEQVPAQNSQPLSQNLASAYSEAPVAQEPVLTAQVQNQLAPSSYGQNSGAASAQDSFAPVSGQSSAAAQNSSDSGFATSQSAPAQLPTSGVLSEDEPALTPNNNGILPPPENFKITKEEEDLLDQFLLRWEEFGRHIKRVSCEVQIKEHDGGLFLQNNAGGKIPLSHTWGKFRFIAPNKLLYHVEGEYVYQPGPSSDSEPEMEFKKGSGELKYVCDGKSWAEYDFRNRVVNVYPIPEEQWNMDLTMDGPFPLFFIANAKHLKNRFYMSIVTPKARQKSEVWIEAYPRQVADSGSFQRIIIILRLSDLQPSYMRKYYVNGKSYSELWFENVSLNKGMWNIDATVDFGWEKKVKEEAFAIAPINPPAAK